MAVSGRLTEEWREEHAAELPSAEELLAQVRKERREAWEKAELEPSIPGYVSINVAEPYFHAVIGPMNWVRGTLKTICDIVGGSQPPKSVFVDAPRDGYIRLIQIRDYKSDEKAVYIPKELAKRYCTKDDVMIGRYGPPIFQILRGLEGSYNVALMKAVPAPYIERNYLFIILSNPLIQKYVDAGSDRTAGQAGVNLPQLYSYPVFIPSLPEQDEIVRRVDELFAYADALDARVAEARKLTERLEPSILAKAFRGELSEQIPEEAAEWELKLAEIEAAAGELAKQATGRKTNRPKQDVALPAASAPPRKRGRPRKT